MLILAFDTATDKLTVALGTENKILAEIDQMAPRGHMERLVPTIDHLLRDSKKKLDDIDLIAVGLGPGSFTGVRIGVSTARGLAQGLNKKVVGIATPDCIVSGIGQDGKIACVIDAKRSEVYSIFYRSLGDRIERLTDYEIVTPEVFRQKVERDEASRIILAGDALSVYGELFKNALGSKIQFAPVDKWYPQASNLIRLFSAGNITQDGTLSEVQPIYVRLSQAEEVWQKKHEGKMKIITLVGMKQSDLEEVLKIERNLFPSPWNQWMFKSEIDNQRSLVLVAREVDKITGYAAINYFEQEGHLMNLAVIPKYQNLGVGSVLLLRLIEFAKQQGVRRITLEVRPSNVSARELYRKFDFQEIGVRKKYYSETNENGLILWTGDILLQKFEEKLTRIEKELSKKFKVIDHTLF